MTLCGKKRFSDPKDAKHRMRLLKRLGTLRKYTIIYFCDPCQAWHFGRIPKDAFTTLNAIIQITRDRHECPTIDDLMIAYGLNQTRLNEAVLVLKAYGWLRPEFNERLVLSAKHFNSKEP